MRQGLEKNVRVCIRCRPFIAQEQRKGHTGELLNVSAEDNVVSVRSSRNDEKAMEKNFQYDRVLDADTTQAQMFEECGVKGMIDRVANGFHATVFAYGQTSSGKTYTMEGYRYDSQQSSTLTPQVRALREDSRLRCTGLHASCSYQRGIVTCGCQVNFDVDENAIGIMPRSIREVFAAVNQVRCPWMRPYALQHALLKCVACRWQRKQQVADESFRIRVSYVQIYMERIYDLLSPDGTKVERAVQGKQRGAWNMPGNSRLKKVPFIAACAVECFARQVK